MVSTRRIHIVLLAAAALLLSACATLTRLAYSNAALAYSNLPPMVAWTVDDYVEMSGAQKDWVRDRLDRLFEWHRANELPEYHRFLQRVLAETHEPFTVAEVGEAYRDLRKHYRRMMEQVIPHVADFLAQLDADQVAQMEKKFAEDQRKFLRESLKGAPEKRLERRVKRFVNHLEGWLGHVNDAQVRLIESHYRSIPELIEERLADRKVRHQETISLLRARSNRDQLLAGLRKLMLDTETWRRPEYRARLADRDARFFEMLAALSATLDREQRAHLQKRIRGFMRDIDTLTAGKAGVG